MTYFNFDALNYNMSKLQRFKSVKTICQLELGRAKVARHDAFIKKVKNQAFNSRENLTLADYYSEKFTKVLLCMTESNRFILQKEFLEKNNDKFWYEDFMSKTTYYKRRNEAVDEFLYFYLD
ncbi:MG284/MPN403 family protein [Mycoplasmopsis lipofaciens]|uniref:MG284/MPN403 family protein n=1 Tax=Mycoplasmopsis lipofaciens TaxID=114884 RepID=UPI00047FA757|nr:hypothetical protein [Mycoplasmopsis lipofaciens]